MDTLARTLAYLDKLPVAVSGSGGHNATLRAACECIRFGLDDGQAWEALTWYNNFRCQPKWTEHELRHKLTDAKTIVQGSGQAGKHLGSQNINRRQKRSFVAPSAPFQKIKMALPPVWKRQADAEESWWSEIASQQGLSLAEFDRMCGIETGE